MKLVCPKGIEPPTHSLEGLVLGHKLLILLNYFKPCNNCAMRV